MGDLSGDLFHEGEIDAAIGLGRGGDGDEEDFAMIDALLGAGGEAEALGGDVFLHEGFQAGLINGDLAGEEGLDLAGIIVHADDVMADFGEAGACGESDITRTDDGELHEEEKEVGEVPPKAGRAVLETLYSMK